MRLFPFVPRHLARGTHALLVTLPRSHGDVEGMNRTPAAQHVEQETQARGLLDETVFSHTRLFEVSPTVLAGSAKVQYSAATSSSRAARLFGFTVRSHDRGHNKQSSRGVVWPKKK